VSILISENSYSKLCCNKFFFIYILLRIIIINLKTNLARALQYFSFILIRIREYYKSNF